MKRHALIAWLAFGLAPLAGCEDGYSSRIAVGWSSSPYYGWYDGFYGPIYDGYWGLDNFFYYRLAPQQQVFRRGDIQHFRRGDAPAPGPQFHRFEGTLRRPPEGTRMPRFRPPN